MYTRRPLSQRFQSFYGKTSGNPLIIFEEDFRMMLSRKYSEISSEMIDHFDNLGKFFNALVTTRNITGNYNSIVPPVLRLNQRCFSFNVDNGQIVEFDANDDAITSDSFIVIDLVCTEEDKVGLSLDNIHYLYWMFADFIVCSRLIPTDWKDVLKSVHVVRNHYGPTDEKSTFMQEINHGILNIRFTLGHNFTLGVDESDLVENCIHRPGVVFKLVCRGIPAWNDGRASFTDIDVLGFVIVSTDGNVVEFIHTKSQEAVITMHDLFTTFQLMHVRTVRVTLDQLFYIQDEKEFKDVWRAFNSADYVDFTNHRLFRDVYRVETNSGIPMSFVEYMHTVNEWTANSILMSRQYNT